MIPESQRAAYRLEGMTLDGGWTVVSRWEARPERSPGAFSVGYLAKNEDGRLGYCNALDFTGALEEHNPAAALQDLLDQYSFECDVLRLCGERRLSRVVSVLANGTVRVRDAVPNAVSYLILELADGDARDLLDLSDPADAMMRLRAAQHAAVGLSQLHRIGVMHQDFKPANLLTWRNADLSGWEGKLGDLGCAYDASQVGPLDDFVVPGDPAYAAPEMLYDGGELHPLSWRQAGEMFTFGNLLCYLVCGVSFTGIQALYLDRDLQWREYSGTFREVLPFLVDAYGRVLRRLEEDLHSEIARDVVMMLAELCHPDPHQRGDQIARHQGQNPFALTRFITRLDLLIRRIPVRRARSA